jgi:hypothetical protein
MSVRYGSGLACLRELTRLKAFCRSFSFRHCSKVHLDRFPAELNRGFPIVCE